MTVYGDTALYLAVVYGLVAFASFFVALRLRDDPKQEYITPRRWAWLVGVFFAILSVLILPAFTIDNLENGSDGSCEWVINSSFTNTTTDPVNASGADYGEMFHYNAVGTTQTVGVANTWIEIRVYEAGNLNNVTFDTGDDTLAPVNGDVYSIEWSLSFAGGVSDEYKIAPFINNVTEVTRCNQHRKLGTGGDVGSASGSCLWNFGENDTVGLKIQNIGDTNDIDVYGSNVNIQRQTGSLFQEGQNTEATTTYTHVNTCATVSVPGYVNSILQIQLWLVWITLFILFTGTLFYTIRKFGGGLV